MPMAFALLAGILAILNPCGFVLLPAALSFYVGAQDEQSSHGRSRALQSILAGVAVTTGFLTVFAIVGVPIALGADQVARTFPWAGLFLGVVLAVVAIATLSGKRIPTGRLRRSGRPSGPAGMLLFGAGYGVASLGCSLPIMLVVIGATLTTRGDLATLAVLGAYALGMAVVLMALSIGAAMLRDGIARTLDRVIPHMRWLSGGLLLLVSAYLIDYWGTMLFGSVSAQNNDPMLAFIQRSTSSIQNWVDSVGGRWVLIGSAAVVAVTAVVAVWQWVFRDEETSDPQPRPAQARRLPAAAACDCAPAEDPVAMVADHSQAPKS